MNNSHQTPISIVDAIRKVTLAVENSSPSELCKIFNSLNKKEVLFLLSTQEGGEPQFTCVPIKDVEKWATKSELSYEKSPRYSDNLWLFSLNGVNSDNSYATTHEAMLAAYELIVLQGADLGNYDLFECERCNWYFDIESSHRVDDQLVCDTCIAQ